MLHKTDTHVYNNCFKLCSSATKKHILHELPVLVKAAGAIGSVNAGANWKGTKDKSANADDVTMLIGLCFPPPQSGYSFFHLLTSK